MLLSMLFACFSGCPLQDSKPAELCFNILYLSVWPFAGLRYGSASLVLKGHEDDALHGSCGLSSAEQRRGITFRNLIASLFLMQPRMLLDAVAARARGCLMVSTRTHVLSCKAVLQPIGPSLQ